MEDEKTFVTSENTKESKTSTEEYKAFIESAFAGSAKVWIPRLGKEFFLDLRNLFDSKGNSQYYTKPEDLVIKEITISRTYENGQPVGWRAVLVDPLAPKKDKDIER